MIQRGFGYLLHLPFLLAERVIFASLSKDPLETLLLALAQQLFFA
jgi:hypothetical protein